MTPNHFQPYIRWGTRGHGGRGDDDVTRPSGPSGHMIGDGTRRRRPVKARR